MKRIYYLMFISFSIIAGCDDREQSLQLLNEPPKITFDKNNSEAIELKDSLRLFPGQNNVYNLFLNVTDVNKNIQFVNWEITKGDYKIFFQSKDVQLPNSFRTEYNKMVLNFFPQTIGNYAAQFKATDRFGKIAIGSFELFVFENLTPVSLLKVEKSSSNENEYILDGSKSYDPDINFKGGLTYYEFDVDGIVMKLKNGTLKNIFEKGTHTISLIVYDNSGAISNKSTVSITVN